MKRALHSSGRWTWGRIFGLHGRDSRSCVRSSAIAKGPERELEAARRHALPDQMLPREAFVRAVLGEHATTRKLLETLEAMRAKRYVSPGELARSYAMIGQLSQLTHSVIATCNRTSSRTSASGDSTRAPAFLLAKALLLLEKRKVAAKARQVVARARNTITQACAVQYLPLN